MLHHPHLHCIIPGGELSTDQRCWVGCRPGFLLSVRVLSRLYRRLFLEGLQQAFEKGELQFFSSLESLQDANRFANYLRPVKEIEWVVYAKPPFAGPEQVLAYLGRYTHRVAISNNRFVREDDGRVAFRWKDYRQNGHQKTMTLDADEFIRRFLLHVLPNGLQRIRHYGLFANRHRVQKLAQCRFLLEATVIDRKIDPELDYRDLFEQLTGRSLRECPHCEIGQLPKNPLSKALKYACDRQQSLREFLTDPSIALDTNHLERGLRVIPMGHRNWLFCWTELGAKHVGLIQSLIVTCRLHEIDPAVYLTDVLQRVKTHPAETMIELTPRVWKTKFAENPLISDLERIGKNGAI